MAKNLIDGIKAVGIGRVASKNLTTEQIKGIIEELKNDKTVHPASRGAFFGAIIMKGLTEEEKLLDTAFPQKGTLENPVKLVEILDSAAPLKIKELSVKLLKKESLTYGEAKILVDFILSDEKGAALRGLALSVLRVRYETADEYKGFLESMNESIIPAFKKDPPSGEPIVQISEPFDGFTRSNIVSPIIAHNIQKLGYRVVSLTGRNPGPKFGVNILDIGKALNGVFIKTPDELKPPKPDFGWFINQEYISPKLDKCVEIRHATVKRPFLSTLERLINPVKADIFISSAFHKPFGEKILTVAENAGYRAMICLMNGVEGSTAFSISKPVKFMYTAKRPNGKYERGEIDFNIHDRIKTDIKEEEKLSSHCEEPQNGATKQSENNIKLIRKFKDTGSSGEEKFDLRIRATTLGFREALEKLRSNA